MPDIVYRDDHREFTIKKLGGNELEVTIRGSVSNQSMNVRRDGWHAELRMSFDELLAFHESCGEGPHSHVVKVPLGTTDVLFQPKGTDHPSR